MNAALVRESGRSAMALMQGEGAALAGRGLAELVPDQRAAPRAVTVRVAMGMSKPRRAAALPP
ncbi:hypothetical protein BHS04_35785 [Myxococcus xanthus]|nr:hypothetical protein BHS04_35785 [Myxococcus xanthus]